eukprot:92428-Chlamydomonas_euryale.AAC.7
MMHMQASRHAATPARPSPVADNASVKPSSSTPAALPWAQPRPGSEPPRSPSSARSEARTASALASADSGASSLETTRMWEAAPTSISDRVQSVPMSQALASVPRSRCAAYSRAPSSLLMHLATAPTAPSSLKLECATQCCSGALKPEDATLCCSDDARPCAALDAGAATELMDLPADFFYGRSFTAELPQLPRGRSTMTLSGSTIQHSRAATASDGQIPVGSNDQSGIDSVPAAIASPAVGVFSATLILNKAAMLPPLPLKPRDVPTWDEVQDGRANAAWLGDSGGGTGHAVGSFVRYECTLSPVMQSSATVATSQGSLARLSAGCSAAGSRARSSASAPVLPSLTPANMHSESGGRWSLLC